MSVAKMVRAAQGSFIALIAVASFGGAQATAKAAKDVSGTYTSVWTRPETGDALGAEVEVHTGPRPKVVVTICEGSCWGGKTWPAIITKDQITFSVIEDLVDQDGKPVPQRLDFAGTFRAGSLVLNQKRGGPKNSGACLAPESGRRLDLDAVRTPADRR